MILPAFRIKDHWIEFDTSTLKSEPQVSSGTRTWVTSFLHLRTTRSHWGKIEKYIMYDLLTSNQSKTTVFKQARWFNTRGFIFYKQQERVIIPKRTRRDSRCHTHEHEIWRRKKRKGREWTEIVQTTKENSRKTKSTHHDVTHMHAPCTHPGDQ